MFFFSVYQKAWWYFLKRDGVGSKWPPTVYAKCVGADPRKQSRGAKKAYRLLHLIALALLNLFDKFR